MGEEGPELWIGHPPSLSVCLNKSPESGQGNQGVQSLAEHIPSEEGGGEERGVNLSLCCLKPG